MSSKKGKVGKTLKTIQHELRNGRAKNTKIAQKTQPQASISPLNVSSIEKASFLEDDEMLSFGNPLHSTALEEDLSPNLGQKTEAPKTLARKKGAKASEENRREISLTSGHARKGQTSGGVQPPSRGSAQKGSQPRSQRKSLGGKSKTRPLQRVSEGVEVEETTGLQKAVTSAAPVSEDSDSAGPVAQGPAPKQPRATLGAKRTPKKAKAPAVPKKTLPTPSEGSAASLGQETGPSQSTVTEAGEGSSKTASAQRRRLSCLSSEELSGEDPSWHAEPSKNTLGANHLGKRRKSTSRSSGAQKRKSSSGSSGSAGPSKKTKPQQRNTKNPIDLEVVLYAFQDFVSQFKETIESASVGQAIDAVSDKFQDQLVELITNTKELKSLKKQNIKVNGAINRKRARLVEVKSEMMQKETQLRQLQREHDQLEERLSDLRRGTAFLSDLRDLHKNYLTHRERHPNEVEVYGPSSLPALLLEARSFLGAEQQLKNVNEKLQQVLDQANHKET